MNNKRHIFFSLLIFLSFFYACDKQSTSPEKPRQTQRGALENAESLSEFSINQLSFLISQYVLDFDFNLNYTVKAYRLEYWTVDAYGEPALVSGAFIFPETNNTLPLLSIQHGTETHRQKVASVHPLQSMEGVAGLLLASDGYAVSIPDYLGYGISSGIHPYHHAETSAATVIDMIRAVQAFCSQENIRTDKLFLAGYSQGGYVTMAAQREIEKNFSNEFDLTAVAAMAGAYDLKGTAFSILEDNEYPTPLYLAFILTAYNQIYQWNALDDIFLPPYNQKVLNYFDGSQNMSAITADLPSQLDSLFQNVFINSVLEETNSRAIGAMQENTLLDWAPAAPLHLIHGGSDETVPFQNALTAIDSLNARGGENIELTVIPGGTHESAAIPALAAAYAWLQNFLD